MDVTDFMQGGLEKLLAESDGSDAEDTAAAAHDEEGDEGEEQEDAVEEEAGEEDSDNDEGPAAANGAGKGSDDDEEEDENDGEEETDEVKELDSEVKQHRAELERLKKKDPEFFKFLEKEDSHLLDFGEDDEEEEDMDDANAEDEEDEDEGDVPDDDGTPMDLDVDAGAHARERRSLAAVTVQRWVEASAKVGPDWQGRCRQLALLGCSYSAAHFCYALPYTPRFRTR
jgi:hypothetical protein